MELKLFNTKKDKLKKDVITNILMYNKQWSRKDLEKKTLNILIKYTHSLDRKEFEDRYNNL